MSNLRLTVAEYSALMGKRRQRPEPKEHVDRWPLVLRDQIAAAGLPVPFREHLFHESRNFRIDLAYPDLKLGIEIDGAVHRIKGRFLSDLQKHNELTLAGWRWIRVTPPQVQSGEALELVRELLCA